MKPEEIAEKDLVSYATERDLRKQMIEEYGISHKESCFTPLILVQDVRKRLGLTQPALASLLSIPVATLQSWEQNPFLMGHGAQILLILLDREPQSAKRTLRALQLDPSGPCYPISDHGVWPALSC